MKRKAVLAFLSMTTLTVGAVAGMIVANKGNLSKITQVAANAYSLDVFDACHENPGASVIAKTSLGNDIVVSTNGVTVFGEKLVIAPGGFIEIARDEAKTHLNALDGLKTIATDFVGRVSYSYRDKIVTYDDAISGNYSFPEDHTPSFVKLYNDSDEAKEVSTLGLQYTCLVSEASFLAGKGTYNVADGAITANGVQTTMTLLKQAKKGILTYQASNNKTNAPTTFMGAAVGLSTDVSNWYKGDATYTWAVLGAKGNATFVQRTTGSDDKPYFAGDTLANHLIKNYEASTFYDFELRFDVDNNYYALYQGDYLMAADTDVTSVGDKIGFICEYGGMAFKNIILKTNVDFHKEVLQRRTKGQIDVYKNNGSNVYETATNEAWFFFKQKLPNKGTIVYDYSVNGVAPQKTGAYNGGLVFADSTDMNALKTARAAIFGTTTAQYNNFTATSSYQNADDSYGVSWMTERNSAKFSYAFDGTVLHLKVEYDLDALTWKYYSRANNESEWEVTGSTGLFQETDNAKLLSGLQYLGFRTLTHDEGFSFVISNLVVNGEAW